jgi:hypothetical protein
MGANKSTRAIDGGRVKWERKKDLPDLPTKDNGLQVQDKAKPVSSKLLKTEHWPRSRRNSRVLLSRTALCRIIQRRVFLLNADYVCIKLEISNRSLAAFLSSNFETGDIILAEPYLN